MVLGGASEISLHSTSTYFDQVVWYAATLVRLRLSSFLGNNLLNNYVHNKKFTCHLLYTDLSSIKIYIFEILQNLQRQLKVFLDQTPAMNILQTFSCFHLLYCFCRFSASDV